MRRTSAPNFTVWLPIVLVTLSVHWNEFPICGNSPSKLFPIVKPPETEMSGTPSRPAPSPGWIPSLCKSRSLMALESETPVKQMADKLDEQEFVTKSVCSECQLVP